MIKVEEPPAEGERKGIGPRIGNALPFPVRIPLALFASFAVVTGYMTRISISMTINRMVVYNRKNGTNMDDVCPLPDDTDSDDEYKPIGEFQWDETLQGHIITCFYIGYLVGQLPLGMAAERLGAKWVVGVCVGFNGICSLLSPIVLRRFGPYAFIFLRILMGTAQGVIFPGLNCLIARWAPLSERGIFGSVVLGSGQIGSIIGNVSSGQILARYDWPMVFYAFGIVTLVWFCFYTVTVYSDPKSHPYISDKELKYLLENTAGVKNRKDIPKTPWKKIFRSAPFWSLLIAQVGFDWGFYALLSCLPKYFDNVLHMPISKTGWASAMPSLAMWIVSICCGLLTDYIVKKQIRSLLFMRNLNSGLAGYCPAVLMITASYAGCNTAVAISLFILCMAFMGFYFGGLKLTSVDLSPNFAGTLMAIVNGSGSITGYIIGPLTGAMTPNRSLSEWRWVFWLAFCVMCSTRTVYIIFNKAHIQPWNDG